MKPTAKTRTQRRLEKKQTVLILVLVLAVSLASFALGVVVGRQGAERDLAQRQIAPERILVTKRPALNSAPTTEESTVPVAEQVPTQEAGTESEPPKLTFYDKLAKEEPAPLGSGINLPQKQAETEPVAVTPPVPLPEQPIVSKTQEQLAKPQPVATKEQVAVAAPTMPQIDPKGSYALQVGSFSSAADAGTLKKKMLAKGYPAYVAEADLGAKGVWYRVRLGPYIGADVAKQAQVLLEKQEKMKGFVTRQ